MTDPIRTPGEKNLAISTESAHLPSQAPVRISLPDMLRIDAVLQEMKRKLNRIFIGLSLLVIFPVAQIALIVLIAGIGSGFQTNFSGPDILALPFLILPTVIGCWGVRLVFRLRGRFNKQIWKKVMLYHGSVLCYCGTWLLTTISYDGISRIQIFGPQERIVGAVLLFLPLFVALFTAPEEMHQSTAEQAMYVNRP